MFRLLLTAALLATAYAAACEELEINYELPPPGGRAAMHVSICPEENTIVSTMADSDEFVAVEVLEDYDSGFAATRVVSQNACFVQDLEFASLEEHASILRPTSKMPLRVNAIVDMVATPLADTSKFGENITKFCGDLDACRIGIRAKGPVPVHEDNARTFSISSNAITSNTPLSCIIILFVPFCTITSG